MTAISPPTYEREVGMGGERQGWQDSDDEVGARPGQRRERCKDRDADEKLVTILAGRVFNSEERVFHSDLAIVVDSQAGIIVNVRPICAGDIEGLNKVRNLAEDGNTVVDLRKQTVLPGFVDVHVHCTYSSAAYTIYSVSPLSL